MQRVSRGRLTDHSIPLLLSPEAHCDPGVVRSRAQNDSKVFEVNFKNTPGKAKGLVRSHNIVRE